MPYGSCPEGHRVPLGQQCGGGWMEQQGQLRQQPSPSIANSFPPLQEEALLQDALLSAFFFSLLLQKIPIPSNNPAKSRKKKNTNVSLHSLPVPVPLTHRA